MRFGEVLFQRKGLCGVAKRWPFGSGGFWAAMALLAAASPAMASTSGLLIFGEGGWARAEMDAGHTRNAEGQLRVYRGSAEGSAFGFGALVSLFPGPHSAVLLGGGLQRSHLQLRPEEGGVAVNVVSTAVETSAGLMISPLSFLEFQALANYTWPTSSRLGKLKEPNSRSRVRGAERRARKAEFGVETRDLYPKGWSGTGRVMTSVLGFRVGAFVRGQLANENSQTPGVPQLSALGLSLGVRI